MTREAEQRELRLRADMEKFKNSARAVSWVS